MAMKSVSKTVLVNPFGKSGHIYKWGSGCGGYNPQKVYGLFYFVKHKYDTCSNLKSIDGGVPMWEFQFLPIPIIFYQNLPITDQQSLIWYWLYTDMSCCTRDGTSCKN